MADKTDEGSGSQTALFDDGAGTARSLLGRLLERSRLYKSSAAYFELLRFVARLRNFSPFNEMLLEIQKPGLAYAASAQDWHKRFGRWPKEGARPLVVLVPFGPIGLVYDLVDTDGRPVPQTAFAFVAYGNISEDQLTEMQGQLGRLSVRCVYFDGGDNAAGRIRRLDGNKGFSGKYRYRISINRNHAAPVRFATLIHELGHLFLGHLGADGALRLSERGTLGTAAEELEAESVSYLVCARNGVSSRSESYLSNCVSRSTEVAEIDLYRIMTAAGRIESALGLAEPTRFASSD